jgi:hypothetical protein
MNLPRISSALDRIVDMLNEIRDCFEEENERLRDPAPPRICIKRTTTSWPNPQPIPDPGEGL